MAGTIVSKMIEASVARVFAVISDVRNFSRAVPDVVKIEMLSEVTSGVGTRFRETRKMAGMDVSTELEITELVENERVRFVSDSHGTVWDSLYTLLPVDGVTKLTLTMDGKPHSAVAKLMASMMDSMLKKTLEKDMEAVKAYCEESANADSD